MTASDKITPFILVTSKFNVFMGSYDDSILNNYAYFDLLLKNTDSPSFSFFHSQMFFENLKYCLLNFIYALHFVVETCWKQNL